jgi:hypothetical protein
MTVPDTAAVAPAVAGERQQFCDAAKLSVALAATALPFVRSRADEAERWLRILRVNGAVGNAMQALGVPEQPLRTGESIAEREPCHPDSLDAVIAVAADHCHADARGAITTADLLAGVLAIYGSAFEHALATRGTTAAEVLERVTGGRRAPC